MGFLLNFNTYYVYWLNLNNQTLNQFKFKENTSQDKIDHAIADFKGLKNKISTIMHMESGSSDSTE